MSDSSPPTHATITMTSSPRTMSSIEAAPRRYGRSVGRQSASVHFEGLETGVGGFERIPRQSNGLSHGGTKTFREPSATIVKDCAGLPFSTAFRCASSGHFSGASRATDREAALPQRSQPGRALEECSGCSPALACQRTCHVGWPPKSHRTMVTTETTYRSDPSLANAAPSSLTCPSLWQFG